MKFFISFIDCCRILTSRIIKDGLLKSASALTYQSFLAIVPLLAVLFGIAKGFGLEPLLNQWLQKEFIDHKEVLDYLLQFSQSTLREAQGGVIAGVGVILLLFTAIRLLSSVEATLNAMWGIHAGRKPLRKVSDYLALLLTCPILLAISGSVTIFVTTHFVLLTRTLGIPESAQNLLIETLRVVPFVTSTLLFTLLLYSVPCAPVRFKAALSSGLIAAVAFQFIQAWYILFQLRLTKVSAVYGSFVALPLFLVWLWISWLLFLFAGELLVFIQERGWRSAVRHYRDTPIEQLNTDVETLSHIKNEFDRGTPLYLKTLVSLQAVPIRALTSSISRLESGEFLLKGWTKGAITTIVPSQKGLNATLADLALPSTVAHSQAISASVLAALQTWKTQLLSSPLNCSIKTIE